MKARVLVVEHDPDTGELLKTVLASEGYQAEWVLETPDLVARVEEYRPDLLVVDLPPVDRRQDSELLDKLRTNTATARIPLLMMTASEFLAGGAATS